MIERLSKEIETITRHMEILEHVVEDQPIGIVKLSNTTGYANPEVRLSLRILENNEVIEPTNNGAVTTDRAVEFFADHEDRIDEVIDGVQRISGVQVEK